MWQRRRKRGKTRPTRTATPPRLPPPLSAPDKGKAEFSLGIREDVKQLTGDMSRRSPSLHNIIFRSTFRIHGNPFRYISRKNVTTPVRLYLTPPSSSSPSGLSSDVDGRLRATKLSKTQPSLRHFCLFPPQNANRHRKQLDEPSGLTCRETSPCKHRTRS